MTTNETQEISITLARIEERVASIQKQVSGLKERAHCATNEARLNNIEKAQAGLNNKWWAAAVIMLGAWVKIIFWPGGAQ